MQDNLSKSTHAVPPVETMTLGEPASGGLPSPNPGHLASTSASSAPAQPSSTDLSREEWRSRAAQQQGDENTLKLIGAGAGTLATISSTIGAAWLFRRWQRERNRPINRLRRRARSMAHDFGEALGDTRLLADRLQDTPYAAPAGGGTALVLSALVASQLLRQRRQDAPAGLSPRDVLEELTERQRQAARTARTAAGTAKAARTGWKMLRTSSGLAADAAGATSGPAIWLARKRAAKAAPSPQQTGLGIGTLAALGALGFLVWRLMRGGHDQEYPGWYSRSPRSEHLPNQ